METEMGLLTDKEIHQYNKSKLHLLFNLKLQEQKDDTHLVVTAFSSPKTADNDDNLQENGAELNDIPLPSSKWQSLIKYPVAEMRSSNSADNDTGSYSEYDHNEVTGDTSIETKSSKGASDRKQVSKLELIKAAAERMNNTAMSYCVGIDLTERESVLKAISLTNLENSKESNLILDDEFFHQLASLVLGKNLELMFIFRNGVSLKIAPNSWISDVSLEDVLEAGFDFCYDADEIDKITEEMENWGGTSYVVQDYIQYWFPFRPLTTKK